MDMRGYTLGVYKVTTDISIEGEKERCITFVLARDLACAIGIANEDTDRGVLISECRSLEVEKILSVNDLRGEKDDLKALAEIVEGK